MIRVALFLAVLLPCPLSAQLKAGAFAIDVTPKKYPVSVNGGFSDVTATSAHDPLHARCLVLDDGKTQVAIVVVDNCLMPRELHESAKAQASKLTRIPANNILISATHTHSAPTVTPCFQSKPNEEYVVYLAERIAEGIQKAHTRLSPAKLGIGKATDDTQLFNRRWKRQHSLIPPDPFGGTTDQVQMNPGNQAPGLIEQVGPTDPEIRYLSVQHTDGKPMALFATYSLHYVGGNPALSADYFGAFSERIKQLVGKENPDFVGALHNGTSGDVNNINFANAALKAAPGERIRVVAESVAQKTAGRYAALEHRQDVTLAVAVRDLDLGVRKPKPAEIERARKILDEQAGKKSLSGSAAVYAGETIALADYPDTVPVKLQAIRIGSAAIVGIPCEVFTEIGLSIKQSSPIADTWAISLANGYNGYLPTPAQHTLGGYETWRARSSYLEVGASPKIVATLKELLKQVKDS
jgi:neutral ceramidase